MRRREQLSPDGNGRYLRNSDCPECPVLPYRVEGRILDGAIVDEPIGNVAYPIKLQQVLGLMVVRRLPDPALHHGDSGGPVWSQQDENARLLGVVHGAPVGKEQQFAYTRLDTAHMTRWFIDKANALMATGRLEETCNSFDAQRCVTSVSCSYYAALEQCSASPNWIPADEICQTAILGGADVDLDECMDSVSSPDGSNVH